MAITKVWIEEGCITCGSSEAACPEVFKIDISRGTTTVLPGVDFTSFESKIKQAAACCPVKVIKIEES
jgi:ferredoxin